MKNILNTIIAHGLNRGLWVCIKFRKTVLTVYGNVLICPVHLLIFGNKHENILYTIHIPQFKPWAIGMNEISENRFNGLWKCINMSRSFVIIWEKT